MCEASDRVIVLEDDLELSPFFLRYMNEALEMYASDSKVAAVHGYVSSVGSELPETFFLHEPGCWGWGTWKRAWDLFEPDGAKLLKMIEEKSLQSRFDWGGAYPHTQLLRDQVLGRNNSWAIRWYATLFLEGKLSLHPGRSLVRNIGFDGSGTHGDNVRRWDTQLTDRPIEVRRRETVEDLAAKRALEKHLWKARIPFWPRRLAAKFLAKVISRIR
jgi:hypothetical protein